jgi:hypothetical protein
MVPYNQKGGKGGRKMKKSKNIFLAKIGKAEIATQKVIPAKLLLGGTKFPKAALVTKKQQTSF